MTNKQSVRLLMALAYFHLNCYDQREAVINKSDLANWMQCKPDQIQLEQYTFTTNDSPSPKRVFLTSEQGTQNVLKFCLNEDFIEPEEWKIQPYEEDIACYQDVGSGSLVWSPGKAT